MSSPAAPPAQAEPTAFVKALEAKGIRSEGRDDILPSVQPPPAPAESVPGKLKPAPEPPPESEAEGVEPASSLSPEPAATAGAPVATQAPADDNKSVIEDEDPETPYFRNADGTFRKGSKKEVRGIISKQQKRIDSLTARLRQAESAPPPAAPSPEGTPDDPKPDYDTYIRNGKSGDDYFEDLGRWGARQEVRQLTSSHRTAAQEQETGELRTELMAARIEAFAESHPDYYQTLNEGPIATLQLPGVLTHVLALDERGPEMAYFLAKNPDETLTLVRELADLPIRSDTLNWTRHRVLLRLGAASQSRGSAPRTPNVSSAPPPMRPVSGGAGSTASVSLEELASQSNGNFDQIRSQWRAGMKARAR